MVVALSEHALHGSATQVPLVHLMSRFGFVGSHVLDPSLAEQGWPGYGSHFILPPLTAQPWQAAATHPVVVHVIIWFGLVVSHRPFPNPDLGQASPTTPFRSQVAFESSLMQPAGPLQGTLRRIPPSHIKPMVEDWQATPPSGEHTSPGKCLVGPQPMTRHAATLAKRRDPIDSLQFTAERSTASAWTRIR